MRLFASIIFLMVSIAGASAQRVAGSGAGTFTCGQFAKEYKDHPDIVEGVYFGWAQGFMSGFNSSLITSKQPWYNIASKSVDEQQSYIRAYCDKHPLATYVQAVFSLLSSLPKLQPPQSN
jgi:hypothetical protein